MLSFRRIMLRETARIQQYFNFALFAAFGPILGCMLLVAIFSKPVMEKIPIAVLDLDGTTYSRELLRMLDASSLVDTAYYVESWDKGISLIRQGKVNAVFGIDRGFGADLLSGGAVVVGRYDNQYMTQGSTVNRAFQETVATFAAKYDAVKYISQTIPYGTIEGYVMPISVNSHVLYNPSLNYAWFLLLGLLPVLWQLFATGTVVYVYGNEFSDGGWKQLASTANRSMMKVFFGKAVPHIILFATQMVVILILLFVVVDIPLRDNKNGLLTLATLLYMLATVSTGFFIIALLRNVGIAMSATSVYVAPAFAYAGVTFPYEAMPKVAKLWADILPITHYHRVLIEIVMRGAPTGDVLTSMAALLPFLLLFPIAILLYKKRFEGYSRGTT